MTRRQAALAGHLQPRSQKHYSNTSPNLILLVQTHPPVAAELLSFSPIPPPWLGILMFGSNFWDPHRKQNSDSVFDSEDPVGFFF